MGLLIRSHPLVAGALRNDRALLHGQVGLPEAITLWRQPQLLQRYLRSLLVDVSFKSNGCALGRDYLNTSPES